METGELVGSQIEANKREERQKVVQFTIPKSLADEFKGACGRNGRAMKDCSRRSNESLRPAITAFRKQGDVMIVIGVDPGIANCGWAVIQSSGVAIRRLDSGVIKSKSKTPTGRRLNNILKVVFDIIVKHRAEYPESKIEMGVEDIFFAKNVNSAISTGKVIGTLECLSDMYTVPITLVNPQQVKKTVLGKGRGSKDEVRDSLNLLLGSNIKEDHEADACGVAMFVLYRFQQ